jgi:hypothetical protein
VGGFKISKAASLPERPEWRWTQYWLNHQDSVLVHTALSVQHLVPTKNTAGVPCHPYSPDLAPCDILYHQRHLFQDVPDIQEQLLTILHVIATGQCQQQQHWIHCMNWKGTTLNWKTVKNYDCKDIICYQLSLGTF